MIQDGKTTTKRVVRAGMDLTRTKLALDDLYLMLTSVLEYVDKIQVRLTTLRPADHSRLIHYSNLPAGWQD